MNKYRDKTDEELIKQLCEGSGSRADTKNSDIEEYLLEKYKPLVRRIAKNDSFRISGGDHDDLIQEGMIGLMKAVKTYDPNRGASFFTFAALCIRGQMINAVEASNRDKNAALNSYLSLYGSVGGAENEEDRRLIDSISELVTRSAEDTAIDIDTAKELDMRIRGELSELEVQVYEMYLSGMSYTEIADILGREAKSIDNAIQRVKNKVQAIIRVQAE